MPEIGHPSSSSVANLTRPAPRSMYPCHGTPGGPGQGVGARLHKGSHTIACRAEFRASGTGALRPEARGVDYVLTAPISAVFGESKSP